MWETLLTQSEKKKKFKQELISNEFQGGIGRKLIYNGLKGLIRNPTSTLFYGSIKQRHTYSTLVKGKQKKLLTNLKLSPILTQEGEKKFLFHFGLQTKLWKRFPPT